MSAPTVNSSSDESAMVFLAPAAPSGRAPSSAESSESISPPRRVIEFSGPPSIVRLSRKRVADGAWVLVKVYRLRGEWFCVASARTCGACGNWDELESDENDEVVSTPTHKLKFF